MSVLGRFFDWRARWRRRSPREETSREPALLPRAMLSILEDVLAWENPHLSLGFLAFVNIVFLVCAHLSMSVLEFAFTVGMMVTCLDALETWLRHKHRTVCLERLAECENTRLLNTLVRTRRWLTHRKEDFLAMREANPTKAFLLVNILLGAAVVVGKAISGAMLLYLLTMAIVLFPIASPPIVRFLKKIHQVAESDGEMDGLLPELSEHNIKELNFEGEAIPETRQSVEPWLPEGAPPGDSSESDDDSHSSSHLPIAANAALEPRDSTDSSEDEYLPQSVGEEEKVYSTVEVLPPASVTWSGSAVSALWSLSGAISGLVARAPPPLVVDKRKRFHSAESSDDFEFIDQSDL